MSAFKHILVAQNPNTIFWYLVTKNIEKQALNIHYQNTIEIVIPLTMTMIPLWHIFISYFIKQLENSASVSQTPAITKKDLRKCLALLSQKKVIIENNHYLHYPKKVVHLFMFHLIFSFIF